MKTEWTLGLLVPLVMFCSLALPANATQTDNRGMHAVPAPGNVTIDGKLDDWDLSGQTLMCYDLESLKDIYSARVAIMYDSANFYISFHWKAPKPMSNSHDPHYQAMRGWAGDSTQLRIKTDQISHVTAWYYAAEKEPAIQIDYGSSLTEPFGGASKMIYRTSGWKMQDGAEMAFLADADGKGYVQEMKLPWKLLTKSGTMHAGDKMNCGVDLLWGDADWPVHRYSDNLAEGASSREFFWTAVNAWGPVILEPKGKLKLPEPEWMRALKPEPMTGPVAISYKLPRDSKVTLAIDDAKTGKRIRNLIAYLDRPAGVNTERWDGLDDEGKPVPPGEYRYKALYHDGIHSSYLMSFANPGNPTWTTSDGRGAFYSDHTAPQAAAAAGDYVILACPMGEAGQHLICCDLTGQRLWGLGNRAAFDFGHIALATDGKTLWVTNEGKTSIVYRVDLATGRYKPWNTTAKDENGAEYKVLDLQVSKLPGVGADKQAGINMTAIALQKGAVAVCFARENQIRILDAETGAVQTEVAVPSPRSVVFDNDGSLIVLSKNQLLRVGRDGKNQPFTSDQVTDGCGLAIDSARNVYLSVRGAAQNVQVYSPEGKRLREIGKIGGRPLNGPYDPEAMRNPAGLAIDSKGRLWVTEETANPKRTSLWSVDGKLERDFPGTTSYAGSGAINPYDPTMAVSDNTVYKIDVEKGTWSPVYSLAKQDGVNDLFPVRAGSHVRFLQHDGHTFIFTSDRTGEGRCQMLDKGRWRPASSVGVVRKDNDDENGVDFHHPFFNGHVGQLYSWTDANGDGLVQENELTFAQPELQGKPLMPHSPYWGSLPDTVGTLIYTVMNKDALVKFPIIGWSACGAPRYDVANPPVVATAEGTLAGNGEGMMMGGGDGRVYLNQSPLLAMDRNGQILGTYPSHHVSVHGSHTARASRPGYLIGPSAILGTVDGGKETGEIFAMNGNLGENYFFTQDALFIQALFKDTRGWFETPSRAVRGMSMDATTAGGESFGGYFLKTPGGKYLLTLSGTDARVLELTGFESIKRFQGKISYTPAQFTAAQELVHKRAVQQSQSKIYTVAAASAPITMDGKWEKWPELVDDRASLMEIQESQQQRYGRVSARYDADNLYLAYRVIGRDKIHNSGQNEKLLFKTGDCVDLMIGSESGAANDGQRILLTMMDNKPIAILNRKHDKGAPTSERYEFTSPWRAIAFDRVSRAPEITLATGGIHDGYLLEATIPWKTLGIKPHTGLKLKADVGVLFGDSGGTLTIARQYWCNKATGLVNDIPGEAELTPDLWGEFILK